MHLAPARKNWSSIASLGTFFLLTFLIASCATMSNSSKKEPPPAITETMDLEDAIEAAINHGELTLRDVKSLISKRGQWKPAKLLLESAIDRGIIRYENTQLINAVHLYQAGPHAASTGLFDHLTSSGRPLARQLGWRLAAVMPSQKIGQHVEKQLTKALQDGEDDSLLIPEVADAIRENNLVESYSVARQGLMATGDEAFAHAMIALKPEQASEDFLRYLALATTEELRQLTQTSVNLYTCLVVLRHMEKIPPSVNSGHLDRLFVYAVSRNTALAEMGRRVVLNYIPKNKDHLAVILSGLPAWVQLSWIENARRNMTPVDGLFLAELKKISAQTEVIEEIDDVKMEQR